jgi:hypothetical protein
LIRNLPFDQELRKLAALCLTLERHWRSLTVQSKVMQRDVLKAGIPLELRVI